jgi:lysozyme family protein
MARLDILAPFILSFEGGFVNDPTDRGGATNMGVTIATWRAVGYDKDGDGDIDVDDLKLLTKQEVINIVMRPHYWNRWKADRIKSQSVANILVDWVWASGKHGITKVQEVLGVKVDGVVGDKTLAALNAQDPRAMFDKIRRARILFIDDIIKADPSQKKYRDGWLRRLNSIRFGALAYNTKTETVIKFEDET